MNYPQAKIDRINREADETLKRKIREAMANARDYAPLNDDSQVPEQTETDGDPRTNNDEPKAFHASPPGVFPILTTLGLGASSAAVLATGRVAQQAQQFGGPLVDNLAGAVGGLTHGDYSPV